MAIETKVKVGYDGTAVKHGFDQIAKHGKATGEKLIGAFGFKEIGKAALAFAGIGSVMTVFGKGYETLSWGAELAQLSKQLHMTVPDLMELEEQFRLCRLDGDSLGVTIGKMRMFLEKAWEAPGEERDMLKQMGLGVQQMDKMKNAKQQFEAILNGMSKVAEREQEKYLKSIFGKGGFPISRFIGKSGDLSSQAKKNLGEAPEYIDKHIENLEKAELAIGMLATSIHLAYVHIFDALQHVFGEDFIGKFIKNNLSSGALEKAFNDFAGYLKGKTAGDVFADIGRQMAEGFMSGIGNTFNKRVAGTAQGDYGASSLGISIARAWIDTKALFTHQESHVLGTGTVMTGNVEAFYRGLDRIGEYLSTIVKNGGQLVWGK